MEMMILSILAPALHCDWALSNMQQAMLTTVSIRDTRSVSSYLYYHNESALCVVSCLVLAGMSCLAISFANNFTRDDHPGRGALGLISSLSVETKLNMSV